MVYGEHSGYKIQYADAGQILETTVIQGEKWHAVYSNNLGFETRTETISWDSTMKFKVLSDSSWPPYFYFQGFEPLQKGANADISFLIWKYENTRYCVLKKTDPAARAIKSDIKGEIHFEADTFLIFKGVRTDNLKGPQLLVKWAGDLNGDGHVDLLLRNGQPDNEIYDLVISAMTNDRLLWRHFVRFHEWN